MSNGMVFVLHAGADQKYATELAGALAPLTAIATALPESGERGLQFGLGAACVMVWSQNTQAKAHAYVGALPSGAAATLICIDALEPPQTLRARARVIRGDGAAAPDAEKLRDHITAMHAQQMERSASNARRTAAPRLAGPGKTGEGMAEAKAPMFARSALGLTATLAIVGAAASAIGARTPAVEAAAPAPADSAMPSTAVAFASADADVSNAAAAATLATQTIEAPPRSAQPQRQTLSLGELTVLEPTQREAHEAVSYVARPAPLAETLVALAQPMLAAPAAEAATPGAATPGAATPGAATLDAVTLAPVTLDAATLDALTPDATTPDATTPVSEKDRALPTFVTHTLTRGKEQVLPHHVAQRAK